MHTHNTHMLFIRAEVAQLAVLEQSKRLTEANEALARAAAAKEEAERLLDVRAAEAKAARQALNSVTCDV